MHTSFSFFARAPFRRFGTGPSWRTVLLVAALWFVAGSAWGQVGFPGAPEEPGVNVRLYPTDVWGPRSGIGVGVGLVGHQLLKPDDLWLLTAAPARFEQVGTLSFTSANPRRARRLFQVRIRGLHSDRGWIGPWALERSALHARLQAGQVFFGRRLLVQPHLTLVHNTVTGVQERSGISRPSQPAVGPVPSPREKSHTGVRAGVDLRLDLRDRPLITTRGLMLQGTFDRYVPVDGARLRFDQFDLDAYGYVPLGGFHRLAIRGALTLTSQRDEARVPIYMLPTLGASTIPGWARAQFVGPDRLVGSLLYRFPLYRLEQVALLEGHLGVHLGSVYQDVGDQFRPAVRFDEVEEPGAPPLRPAASIGVRAAMPFRHRSTIDLAVGVSPDGVSAAQITVVRRLQALRFPHHAADPVR